MRATIGRRRTGGDRVARIAWSGVLIAGSLTVSAIAQAQAQRSGGGGANAQIMQQYQQLASERTALQADNAKLKKDVESLTAERDALKKERDALRAKAGGSDAASARLAEVTRTSDEKLAEQRKKTEEVVGKYRELAGNLQVVEKERGELQAKYDKRSTQLAQCVDHNQKLKDITNDVLTRYENQSLFKKATLSEPFTKITRSRMQDMVDDYRDQVDTLTIKDVDGVAKAAE